MSAPPPPPPYRTDDVGVNVAPPPPWTPTEADAPEAASDQKKREEERPAAGADEKRHGDESEPPCGSGRKVEVPIKVVIEVDFAEADGSPFARCRFDHVTIVEAPYAPPKSGMNSLLSVRDGKPSIHEIVSCDKSYIASIADDIIRKSIAETHEIIKRDKLTDDGEQIRSIKVIWAGVPSGRLDEIKPGVTKSLSILTE